MRRYVEIGKVYHHIGTFTLVVDELVVQVSHCQSSVVMAVCVIRIHRII